MTFEDMVAGRRETDDVALAERHGGDDYDTPEPGFIYPTGLYIGRVGAHWSEEARVAGAFHLLIGNQEWIDDDLAHLERILWRAYEDELLEEPAP